MTSRETPPGTAMVDENGDQDPATPSQHEPVRAEEPPVAERVGELEDQLRRALADLDNFRKRFERELRREREAERSRAAASWLPIVDDLERALEHADSDRSPIVEGVRAVHEHAVALLERLGFRRFGGVGEPFDPTRHEAVGAIDADEPKGTVVAVVRPGYGSDDELLRPAGVVVAKGSS